MAIRNNYFFIHLRQLHKQSFPSPPSPMLQIFMMHGHSLPSIDTSTTFRVFLQNLNGINLDLNNYSLLHDLQTCASYGAAVILLPETNVHWAMSGSWYHSKWKHPTLFCNIGCQFLSLKIGWHSCSSKQPWVSTQCCLQCWSIVAIVGLQHWFSLNLMTMLGWKFCLYPMLF